MLPLLTTLSEDARLLGAVNTAMLREGKREGHKTVFVPGILLSGMAIGTQFGFVLGGFAPTISAAIIGTGPNGWMPVAAFTSVTAIISAVSIATARETYKTPLYSLGRRAAQSMGH